jgi:hypothetical protein
VKHSSNHDSPDHDPEVTVVSVTSQRPSSMPSAAMTPTGLELVSQTTWDDVTKVYDAEALRVLLAAASPYRHPTFRPLPAFR